MKFFTISRLSLLPVLMILLAFAATAQNDGKKVELLSKIAKSSNSKKTEEKAKAYELSKIYLAQYGKDTDENTKKVRIFVESYRIDTFNKALTDNKMPEAIAISKDILAENPNDVFVSSGLAYGGYDLFNKKQDKTYADEAIKNARQTLAYYDGGNTSKDYSPFKTKDETVAMMHYIIGSFSKEADLKLAAGEFYKSTQPESSIKKESYPYSVIADYYVQVYQQAGNEFNSKYSALPADNPEVKAAQANLNKTLDRLLDAYIRALKNAETEPDNQAKTAWTTNLQTIYKSKFKDSPVTLDEFSKKILDSPLPDPNTL